MKIVQKSKTFEKVESFLISLGKNDSTELTKISHDNCLFILEKKTNLDSEKVSFVYYERVSLLNPTHPRFLDDPVLLHSLIKAIEA